MSQDKLMKVLQAAGIDSRRTIRQDINDGRYLVNNRVITDPNFMVDIDKDTVRHDDKKLKLKIEKKSYFLFNKPYGVVTTLQDPQERTTLTEFISRIKERVYPVGRLDYHSEGLIVLTNDGDFTNFIISAKNKIPKIYMLKIKGSLSEEERRKLSDKGIHLDGVRVIPQRIEFVKKTGQGNSWIRVTIVEGKKHILRKVFKYSGHPVEKLKRTAVGTFRLKTLPVGHWREITQEELDEFKRVYHYEEGSNNNEGKERSVRKTAKARSLKKARPVSKDLFQKKDPHVSKARPERKERTESKAQPKRKERTEYRDRPERKERTDYNAGSERKERTEYRDRPERKERTASNDSRVGKGRAVVKKIGVKKVGKY